MNTNELDFLDLLTIFSVMLQLKNYEQNLKEADNNYIIREIDKTAEQIENKQNLIIQQQKEIISLLKNK